MTTHRGTAPSAHDVRRLTITDVARAAGVSISVVSYALNGRSGVSESTRRHVLRVADDLGWRPSAAARSLRSRPDSVALHVGPAGHRAALEVADGLQAAVLTDGLTVSVEVAPDLGAAGARLESAWTERRHAGFVATDLRHDDPRSRAADRVGAPLVRVSPTGPSAVWFDGRAETDAAHYLVGLEHRRIALLVRDEGLDVARSLRAGLVEATPGTPGAVVVLEYGRREDAATVAARLLAAPGRPTAVVADDDLAALAVIEAARRRGLEVPWDVSVVAGEDSPTCRLVGPPLTAVSRPYAALGPRVLAALGAALGSGPDSAGQEQAVAARLVIRGSTAPPGDHGAGAGGSGA